LIEHGADLNLKDINKNTPLHIVCKTGNIEAIPYLLENPKLDLKCKDKNS